MPRVPLDVVGSAYSDSTKPISVQECINYYVETVEEGGARVPKALKGTPGLLTFSSIGNEALRGSHVAAELLYVVSGTTAYRIASDGTATSLGTVAGTGHVVISDMRIAGGNQIVFVNGTQGYVYNTATAAFAQIADVDFQAADVVDFLDNFAIFNWSGTAKFFICALADATSYDSLDIATKESGTEDLVTLKVNHGLLYLFGSRRSEVWQNTGNADFPFERINGATFDIGCAGKFARTTLNDRLYFLGSDAKAYVMNGYQPQRISTHAIEQALADEDISTCQMYAQSDRGHDFIFFRFPTGKTWVYDGGYWHRRKSHDLTTWRVNGYAYCYGKHLAMDSILGRIGEMDPETFDEYGNPLVAERTTAYAHNEQNAMLLPELEYVFDTGNGLNTGQGSDPVVDFSFSDDFGRNFTNWRTASLGKVGEYGKRVRFHRLGRFRNRAFRHRISDPIRRDCLSATANVIALPR